MPRLASIVAAVALLLVAATPAVAGSATAPPLTAYCTNSEVAYTIAFPGDWFTNQRVEGDDPPQDVAACRFFSPSDFSVTPGAEPSGIAIGIFNHSGSIPDGEAITVDGFEAVRTEVGDAGDMTYLIAIQLTADAHLSIQTNENWEGDYGENRAIIDRQAEGMEIHPFGDVGDSPFVWQIAEIYDFGVTAGCAASAYCPENAITREQMASFLARAWDVPPTSEDFFTDDEDSIHEGAINRIAAAGITAGCREDAFCPDELVTREQMASFIVRADDPPAATADYFGDDEDSVHEDAINRLAEAGITGGCAPNRYCPALAVTRGQMAAFLYRALVD